MDILLVLAGGEVDAGAVEIAAVSVKQSAT
jgi:hypothetical protein